MTADHPMQRLQAADVHAAAWEVLREGKAPSGDEIRRRLGRGSKTTIYAHLATFWEDVAAKLTTAQLPDLPQPVGEAFVQVWQLACETGLAAAERALQRKQEAADARHAEAVTAIEQSRRDAADARDAVDSAQRERAEALRLRGEAVQALQETKSALAALQREHDRVVRDYTELERALVREREALASTNAAHRAEIETLAQQAREASERLSAQHTIERDRLMVELDRVRRDRAESDARSAQQLDQMEGRLRAAQDAANASALATTRTTTRLESELAAARDQLSTLEQTLDAERDGHRATREELRRAMDLIAAAGKSASKRPRGASKA